MATISKKEIVKAVSEKHGLTTTQTGQIIQVFMDQIIEELSRGNRIEFREFGIFELKRRKPRIARNPKTGESVQVPEKTVVSFKPGKVMKARVVDTLPAGKNEPGRAPAPAASTPSSPTPSPAATTPSPTPPPPPASHPSPAPSPSPPPPPPPPAPSPSPSDGSTGSGGQAPTPGHSSPSPGPTPPSFRPPFGT